MRIRMVRCKRVRACAFGLMFVSIKMRSHV